MAHDSDYFRRRAAEARAAAFCKEQGDSVEVAGDLALAYAALARRQAAKAAPTPTPTVTVTEEPTNPILLETS